MTTALLALWPGLPTLSLPDKSSPTAPPGERNPTNSRGGSGRLSPPESRQHWPSARTPGAARVPRASRRAPGPLGSAFPPGPCPASQHSGGPIRAAGGAAPHRKRPSGMPGRPSQDPRVRWVKVPGSRSDQPAARAPDWEQPISAPGRRSPIRARLLRHFLLEGVGNVGRKEVPRPEGVGPVGVSKWPGTSWRLRCVMWVHCGQMLLLRSSGLAGPGWGPRRVGSRWGGGLGDGR